MVKQGKIKTRRDGYRDLRKRVACRMGRAAQTRSRHGMQSMQALRNPSLFAPSLMGFAAPSMAARVGRARHAALPRLYVPFLVRGVSPSMCIRGLPGLAG